jgi:hypothetical protein
VITTLAFFLAERFCSSTARLIRIHEHVLHCVPVPSQLGWLGRAREHHAVLTEAEANRFVAPLHVQRGDRVDPGSPRPGGPSACAQKQAMSQSILIASAASAIFMLITPNNPRSTGTKE